jgi:hypothetical protein
MKMTKRAAEPNANKLKWPRKSGDIRISLPFFAAVHEQAEVLPSLDGE